MANSDTTEEHCIESLIEKMEGVRRVNNVNWMDVLRLAIKYAPRDEVMRVLRRIRHYDATIGNIWDELKDEMGGC